MVNGSTFFTAAASPRFAVKFFVATLIFTAVASPPFAVKFFMAALFNRGGIPAIRGQVLRGDAHFHCGGIPTVRGQVLHGSTFLPRCIDMGTFLTAMASPRLAVKFFMAAPFPPRWHPHGSRMGLVRSSRPLLLMLAAVVCVDGSDWHLKLSGRR